jgi:hypothetical protein
MWVGADHNAMPPMGKDVTEALDWVTKHKDRISSLSSAGLLTPGRGREPPPPGLIIP